MLIVVVSCSKNGCADVRVGDYLEADGEQGDDGRFHADTVRAIHL